jgi:hypothetical protein
MYVSLKYFTYDFYLRPSYFGNQNQPTKPQGLFPDHDGLKDLSPQAHSQYNSQTIFKGQNCDQKL